MNQKHKIAFVGNSLQTMCNFRLGVMAELAHLGHEVVVIAPKDSDITALKQNRIRLIPVDIDCKGMNPFVDLQLVTTLKKIYKEEQFDFIFADPPYVLTEIPQLPDMILERNLLREGGIMVLEHGKDHDFSSHTRFVEHRQYGSVNFSFFR